MELIKLIARGEDSRIQFKENVNNPESLAGELVAFSNGNGGQIIIGVNDNGEAVGLSGDDIKRINQLLANTATNHVRPSINPRTENVEIGGRLVMVATVSEGISKPYCDNGGVIWVKCGADKRRVTSREEIQRMLQGAGLVHADGVPVQGATVADLDLKHFSDFYNKQYGEQFNQAGLPPAQLLSNLGLAKDGTLNLAGLMLFGAHPQRYCPVLVVKAVSFVGNNAVGTRYRDSEDLGGCLKELHTRSMSFILRNLRRIQGRKGFNSEGDLEVSSQALEELVVNMLLHRDYFISAPWRLFLFDNRIEIISPGALPNNLTIEHAKHGVSNIRNPLIASFATKELPYRGLGTGIPRALAEVPGIEFESNSELNTFTARIPRPGAQLEGVVDFV
jgi:ATP-dependent DNA helicase RecG